MLLFHVYASAHAFHSVSLANGELLRLRDGLTPLLRTRSEAEQAGKHWPCNTAVACELHDMLSGGKIPAGLRASIGSYMVKHGFFAEHEFTIAEERMRAYPQAEWVVQSVMPDVEGWTEPIDVHYRDVLVQAASVLRHPRCDPTKDLVWGPEVETDEGTQHCPFGYMGDFCHSATCAKRGRGACGGVGVGCAEKHAPTCVATLVSV